MSVSLRLGVVVAAVVAALLALSAARHGPDHMLRSDGSSFAAVARDPFGDGHTLRSEPGHDGVEYRYGRIAFPLAAWALALGRPSLTDWTLPLVLALSYGALTAAASRFCVASGRSAWTALVVFLAPFLWLTLPGPFLVADPLAVALVLAAYVLFTARRGGAALAVAAAAVLTREAVLPAFLPLAWSELREGGWRRAARWLVVGVPYAGWCLWVRLRVGQFPFLDPAPAARDALGAPFAGALDALRAGSDPALPSALAMAGLTIGAAIWAWRRRPSSPLRNGALCLAVVVPFLGSSAWALPGEALRTMLPVHVCLLLVAVAGEGRAVRRPLDGATA